MSVDCGIQGSSDSCDTFTALVMKSFSICGISDALSSPLHLQLEHKTPGRNPKIHLSETQEMSNFTKAFNLGLYIMHLCCLLYIVSRPTLREKVLLCVQYLRYVPSPSSYLSFWY